MTSLSRLEKIFQTKKDQAQRFMAQWAIVRDQMGEVFGEEREEIATALLALDSANSAAHNHLIDRLDHPTICIATTGTTCGGKSTVINLLCGHEIVPVDAQEMSAGVVTIHHHPRKRTLRILPTDGALWECGEWENLSDNEIESRLRITLDYYHDAKKAAAEDSNLQEPDCPLVELEFPTHIGLSEGYLRLPGTFQLKLMDLPGYKFVGDDGNMNVIRQCKEALCLVIYNSETTDPNLKKNLLQEVVTQVKNLGGSPARMLFVLNRIDAFRRDKDWQKREQKFVEETTTNIKRELLKALPEYEEKINQLNVIKLSSLPAFHALMLQHGEMGEKLASCRHLNKSFRGLLSERLQEDLPGPSRWTELDKKQVAEEIWKSSYAQDFQASVKRHIEEHLPEIIIPQIIDEFKQNIAAKEAQWQNCAVWSVQTLDAAIRMSRDGYQSTRKWLNEVEGKLEKQRQIRAEKLLKPFNRIADIMKNPPSSPAEMAKKLYNELEAIRNEGIYSREDFATLDPLTKWYTALSETAGRFLEEIAIALDSGEPLKGMLFESLPKDERRALRDTYNKLLEREYERRKGTHFEAQTEGQKTQLKKLNETLNDLAEDLSGAMTEIVQNAVEQEKGRIYEAIKTISANHIRQTWEDAKAIAPELGFDVPTMAALDFAKNPLNLEFKFENGFDVKVEIRTVIARWRQEKVGTKRPWYYLWLIEEDVYEDKPVYEQRTYDIADIPSVEGLIENWKQQYRDNEKQVVQGFAAWLISQITQLNALVKKEQQAMVAAYRQKLEHARKSAESKHAAEMEQLLPLYEEAKRLNEDFSTLAEVKSVNE